MVYNVRNDEKSFIYWKIKLRDEKILNLVKKYFTKSRVIGVFGLIGGENFEENLRYCPEENVFYHNETKYHATIYTTEAISKTIVGFNGFKKFINNRNIYYSYEETDIAVRLRKYIELHNLIYKNDKE